MKTLKIISRLAGATTVFALLGISSAAVADEPCPPDGDFGECKVLIEINAEDGDVGFHFLGDGNELVSMAIFNPHYRKIYFDTVRREFKNQTKTETFVESAEPLCWADPEAIEEAEEEGEELEIVTVEDFIDRWEDGTYYFFGVSEGEGWHWDLSFGQTELSYALPAMPDDLDYDEDTGVISWAPGEDLGNCGEAEDEDPNVPNLDDFVHLLAMHPEDVPLASYEAVLEPDVEDGDPAGALVFSIRVPADQTSVTVPADYLASLPENTPVKVEVGAIGWDDNATFAEEDGFCANIVADGCEEED